MATATLTLPDQQYFHLSCVPWDGYDAIGEMLRDRHVRITYDDGEIEFMTLSAAHERFKHLLSMLLAVIFVEMKIDAIGFGSMTCKRKDVRKGIEPDECYYIQSSALVLERESIDLNVDPPPDLALEVEISRSMMKRMKIYARLKIPEVWRWDEENLTIHILNRKGKYEEKARSKALPFLPIEELVRFLKQQYSLNEFRIVRDFRDWVREQIANDWQ